MSAEHDLLSARLAALREEFGNYADTGLQAEGIAVRAFMAVFSQLEDEARSLEAELIELRANKEPGVRREGTR